MTMMVNAIALPTGILLLVSCFLGAVCADCTSYIYRMRCKRKRKRIRAAYVGWTVNDVMSEYANSDQSSRFRAMCSEAERRDARLRALLLDVLLIVPQSSVLLDIGTDALDLIKIARIRDRTERDAVVRASWKHINVPSPWKGLDMATWHKLDDLCRRSGFSGFSDAMRLVPHDLPV